MIDFPPLPESFQAPAGLVRVVLVTAVEKDKDGEECWGEWDEGTRTINIEEGITPEQQWRTFYHEVTHVVLDDSGLDQLYTPKQQEAFCKANASARFRERFG